MNTELDDMLFLDRAATALQRRAGWFLAVVCALALAVGFLCSGCLITSQRVAARRSALRVVPRVVDGSPAVGLAIAPGDGWTTGEKIVGAAEGAGWIGLAAILYELNRKASSDTGDRDPQPTVIQSTVSGNNVYIGRDAHGTVSTRRDEMGD